MLTAGPNPSLSALQRRIREQACPQCRQTPLEHYGNRSGSLAALKMRLNAVICNGCRNDCHTFRVENFRRRHSGWWAGKVATTRSKQLSTLTRPGNTRSTGIGRGGRLHSRQPKNDHFDKTRQYKIDWNRQRWAIALQATEE